MRLVPGPIDETEGMERLAPTQRAAGRLKPGFRCGASARSGHCRDGTFLASDAASYVTGAIIPCDGGLILAGGGIMNPADLAN